MSSKAFLVLAGAAVLATSVANADPLVYTSNASVLTWDPIFPTSAYSDWPSEACTTHPAIGLDADWINQHQASEFGVDAHPWQTGQAFSAQWINAWGNLGSQGPNGQNWTKYATEVSGDGEFVLNLLADNCSWIYLDGTLVGFQDDGQTNPAPSYPVSLTGTHTLEFIIFDGGGLAGGMFRLETNNGSVVFTDTDDDGLTDPEEVLYNTDPNDPDTDGDGTSDGNEVAMGTDPTVPDVFDTDDDGLTDDIDMCTNSIISTTVLVEGVNSGVANTVDAIGCTIADHLTADCSGNFRNHGQFVSCVAHTANSLRKAGLIDGKESSAIVSAAAKSK